MPSYTQLNGIMQGNSQLIDLLEENLMSFFEWGLLEAGFYDDVNIYNLGSATSTYDTPENLSPVSVPGLTDGTVWQAPYRNWVYESGLESVRQPIAVSGIYINGSFQPSSGNTFYIDFINGNVTFNSAIPVSSVVQANYSYKQINLYDQDVPWFNTLIFDAFDADQPTATLPSGVPGLLKQHAIQLPLILVESVATQRQKPKELGNLSQWIYQDFLFHVIAENSLDRNNMVDILTRQKDKVVYIYDTNQRASDNAFALDYRNSLVASPVFYPQLVELPPSGYRINQSRFFEARGVESSASLPLYRGIVRMTMEIDLS